jgi:L-fuculose-phosphate aldolase
VDAKAARKQLIAIGRRISDKGLVVGFGGNISARVGDLVYIKASGRCFEDATEADYVGIDLDSGRLVDGDQQPSSEFRFHCECYKVRPDVMAVVHTHPPVATGLASAGRTVDPITPDFVALLGRAVALTEYVVPTGPELAKVVGHAIKDHDAALLRNHGLVTVGRTLKEAFYRTLIVESSAISIVAGSVVGKIRFLTSNEVAEVDSLKAEKYRREVLKKEAGGA